MTATTSASSRNTNGRSGTTSGGRTSGGPTSGGGVITPIPAGRTGAWTTAPSRRRRLAALALPVAGLWSAGELAAGIAWLRGAPGNPAVPRPDEAPGLSVLHLMTPDVGAAALAGLGAVGLVLVGAMAVQRRSITGGAARRLGRGHGAGGSRRDARGGVTLVVALATALGAVLTLVLPDYRLLAWTAYLPIIAVMSVVGTMPEGVDVWPWPVVHMALATLGGLALVVAAAQHRRLTARCSDCGRSASPGRFAAWAVRRAPWAVGVAVAIPVGYAVTRLAWALGIPFGISREMLDELGDIVWMGAGLAALALGGAVLTLGLVQRWGEVFPRWMLGVRGRRVPIALAVVPASVVSVLVASAGLMFVRYALAGGFGAGVPGEESDVAAWLPEMFWPVWGAALALATYAYAVRRRAACATCARR